MCLVRMIIEKIPRALEGEPFHQYRYYMGGHIDDFSSWLSCGNGKGSPLQNALLLPYERAVKVIKACKNHPDNRSFDIVSYGKDGNIQRVFSCIGSE